MKRPPFNDKTLRAIREAERPMRSFTIKEYLRYIKRKIGWTAQRDQQNTGSGPDDDMTEEEIEREALEENRRIGLDDDWYKDAKRVDPE